MATVQELYVLNRAFVQDPQRPVPLSYAVRDDLFSPAALRALQTAGADTPWTHFSEGLSSIRLDGPATAFRTVNMTRMGCHVVAHDADIPMFHTAAAVAPRDLAGMLAWLTDHAGATFITTGAWYGKGAGGADGIYTMARLGVQKWTERPTAYGLINNGNYILCSGLMLALAMEQAGLWDADVLVAALGRFMCTAAAEDPLLWHITNMTPLWIPFVLNPRYEFEVHLSDAPWLYAAQCGSSPIVLQFLQTNAYGAHGCIVQTKATAPVTYCANMSTAARPRRFGNRLTAPVHITADWAGYITMLLTDGQAWAIWRARPALRAEVLEAARGRRYDLYLPIFHLYERGVEGVATTPRYRLRALLQDVRDHDEGQLSSVLWLRHYMVRLMLKEEAERANIAVHGSLIYYAPPPADFLDGLRAEIGTGFGDWLFAPKDVAVRHPHILTEAEQVAWVAHMVAAGWDVRVTEEGLCLRYTLWKILGALAGAYPTVAAFLARLRRDAAVKLAAVREATKRAGNEAAWQSVVLHMSTRRAVLY